MSSFKLSSSVNFGQIRPTILIGNRNRGTIGESTSPPLSPSLSISSPVTPSSPTLSSNSSSESPSFSLSDLTLRPENDNIIYIPHPPPPPSLSTHFSDNEDNKEQDYEDESEESEESDDSYETDKQPLPAQPLSQQSQPTQQPTQINNNNENDSDKEIEDKCSLGAEVSIYGSSKIMSSYPPSNSPSLLRRGGTINNNNNSNNNKSNINIDIRSSTIFRDSIDNNGISNDRSALFEFELDSSSGNINNNNNSNNNYVFLNNSTSINHNNNNIIDSGEDVVFKQFELDSPILDFLEMSDSNSNILGGGINIGDSIGANIFNENYVGGNSSNNSSNVGNNPVANSGSGGSSAIPHNFDFKVKYHELYRVMSIYQLTDKIVVKPANSVSNGNSNTGIESLVIDRNTFKITSQYYSAEYLNSNSNNFKKKHPPQSPNSPTSQQNDNNNNSNNIKRSNSSISLSNSNSNIPSSNNSNNINSNINSSNNSTSFHQQSILAYGIVGIINLLSGPYLIAITGKQLIGSFGGKYIYRIENCNLILISNSATELSEHDRKMESTYKKSLKSLLKSNFYYCFDYNISESIENHFKNHHQYQQQPTTDTTTTSPSSTNRAHLYQEFNSRFYWNKHLQKSLIANNLNHWILPLIRGYVEIINFFIERNDIEFLLISRRSKFRAGTRYNTRGSDHYGNVANYVETEQIISHQDSFTSKKTTFSFCQTRGSIPLIWEQSGRKIKPEIKISPDQSLNMNSFKLHFNEQIKLYGKQILVTLLDQKGSEAELGEAYRVQAVNSTLMQSSFTSIDGTGDTLPMVEFVPFDFHHFCQGNRFDRVDILIDGLEESLNNYEKIGYTERNSETGYTLHQQGIVRTNCLDCLDRTNLVQSMIGVSMLERQLKILGFNAWTIKDQSLPGTRAIKLAWANNGDAISFQYAGTQALKGDYTRTGKRNTKGVFKDGVNSLTRYYINTFLDKIRQVSIDLFLGLITVETNTTFNSTIQNEYDWGESRMDAINNCVDHFLRSKEGIGSGSAEGFINAWIVISVNKRNQEQERILLLTPSHLVRCKYNFNENKIVHFKQFNLTAVKRIQLGTMENGKKNSYAIKIFHKSTSSSSGSSSGSSSSGSSSGTSPSNGITLRSNNSVKSSPSSPIINSTSNSSLSESLDYSTLSTSPPTSSSLSSINNATVVDDSLVADCSFNQYIIPIPDGESIEFGKDLGKEISESIRDCYVSLLGYSNINQLSYGSSFIVEQDFKLKKSSLVSAAYNGLKLGFYSKSPTAQHLIKSKSLSKSSNSNSNSGNINYSGGSSNGSGNGNGSGNIYYHHQNQQSPNSQQRLHQHHMTISNPSSSSSPLSSLSSITTTTTNSANSNTTSTTTSSTTTTTTSSSTASSISCKKDKRRSKSFDASTSSSYAYKSSEWSNYRGPVSRQINNNISSNNTTTTTTSSINNNNNN